MSEEIRVYVVKYPGRANLVMRYKCPLTGKQHARSTGTPRRKDAEKVAAKWEAELQEGRYSRDSKMGWDEFVIFYEANALAGLSPRTAGTYAGTLNRFKAFCRPERLSDVTTARVTAFVAELREKGVREATIARHLRCVKAFTRWAVKQGLLATPPTITMPKRVRGAKVMRGRPITGEEFDRLALKARAEGPEWEFYVKCLWASGLRLAESLTLSWEDHPGAIVVDLEGDYPMLRIPAEAEKAHRDRVLPIAPEFLELLQSVPEAQRRGRVFRVDHREGVVGKMVSSFGKAAGVVVDDSGKQRKFASAHDLRRSFGARWARKVMPTVLREMMRHSSLQTTMAYYVGADATETAKALWATVEKSPRGNNSGNSGQESGQEENAANGSNSFAGK